MAQSMLGPEVAHELAPPHYSAMKLTIELRDRSPVRPGKPRTTAITGDYRTVTEAKAAGVAMVEGPELLWVRYFSVFQFRNTTLAEWTRNVDS